MLYESDRNNRGLTLVERGTVKYAGERDCIHREQRDGLRVAVGRRCPQCAGRSRWLLCKPLYCNQLRRPREKGVPAGEGKPRWNNTIKAPSSHSHHNMLTRTQQERNKSVTRH